MQHERLDLERLLRPLILPLDGERLDADVVGGSVRDVSGAFAGPFVMVADVARRRERRYSPSPRSGPTCRHGLRGSRRRSSGSAYGPNPG